MATFVYQNTPGAAPSADAYSTVPAELLTVLDEPLAWDPTAEEGLLDGDDLDVLAALAGDDLCGGLEDKSSGCHSGLAAV